MPGYWKNGTWVELPLPSQCTGAAVYGIAVSGTNVYAIGKANAVIATIPVYWLNGAPVTLPVLTAAGGGQVSSIALSGSDVYISGWCVNSIGSPIPGYWLNGTWVGLALPTGPEYGGAVTSLVIQAPS